jgi:hypothetical protein
MGMPKKVIKKHVQKKCSICPREMDVIIYTDKSYRGGHYFGRVPLSTEKEKAKARSFGTRTVKWGDMEVQVCNKDPKPYGYFEYWECLKCYWGGK